jgi:nitroimidazol reductase NimA-like FMN-containing flavoprotein (pyridoxamine 5'-phosphate oxidase superfamily)
MIGILYPDEIESLLYRYHIGHLACLTAEGPYVVPITYSYAGGAVYGHTLPGRKLEALRADRRVSFEVEERGSETTWGSVVAAGVFEELVDEDERTAALACLQGAFPDDSRERDAGTGVVFRLRLTEKSGRFVTSSAPLFGNDVPPLAARQRRADDEATVPEQPGQRALHDPAVPPQPRAGFHARTRNSRSDAASAQGAPEG